MAAVELEWVPETLYNTAISAVVDSYGRARRRDIRSLPENIQFDVYYKVRGLAGPRQPRGVNGGEPAAASGEKCAERRKAGGASGPSSGVPSFARFFRPVGAAALEAPTWLRRRTNASFSPTLNPGTHPRTTCCRMRGLSCRLPPYFKGLVPEKSVAPHKCRRDPAPTLFSLSEWPPFFSPLHFGLSPPNLFRL